MTVMNHVRSASFKMLLVAAIVIGLGSTCLITGRNAFPWLLGAGLVMGATIGGLVTVAGMIRPRWNLTLRRLSAYGSADKIASAIDTELAQTDSVRTFGRPVRSFRIANTGKFSVLVTPSWLLQFTEVGLRAVLLENIASIHQKILTVEYPLLVKDRWYSVIVHEKNGRRTEFEQTQAETDRLLKVLMDVLPRVRFGFP